CCPLSRSPPPLSLVPSLLSLCCAPPPLDLPSFPTRRSSDLCSGAAPGAYPATAERGTQVPASTCLRVRERVYHQMPPMSISTMPAPPNPRAMNTPAILLSSEETKPLISWCGATIALAQGASEDAVNGGALTVYSPAAPVRKVKMLEAATSLIVVFESGPGTGET